MSNPENHTGVIASARDALEKLWWNVGVYENQLSVPGLGDEQGYALIDFATASNSVHAWVCQEYRNLVVEGAEATLGPPENISAYLQTRIRWWRQLRAVSNATKHRTYQANYWPGGENKLLLQGETDCFEQGSEEEILASYIDQINTGEIWYESGLFDEVDGRPVLARVAIHQNYEDWHQVIGQLSTPTAS